jgi:hypothetical protein
LTEDVVVYFFNDIFKEMCLFINGVLIVYFGNADVVKGLDLVQKGVYFDYCLLFKDCSFKI